MTILPNNYSNITLLICFLSPLFFHSFFTSGSNFWGNPLQLVLNDSTMYSMIDGMKNRKKTSLTVIGIYQLVQLWDGQRTLPGLT